MLYGEVNRACNAPSFYLRSVINSSLSLSPSRRIVAISPENARHTVNTNTRTRSVRFCWRPSTLRRSRSQPPVEAYRRLASLIVFLPCAVTLQGCLGPKISALETNTWPTALFHFVISFCIFFLSPCVEAFDRGWT